MTATTARPTYAAVLRAHQRVIRLTARMIGLGARENMDAYFAAAKDRADAEREFEEMLRRFGRG